MSELHDANSIASGSLQSSSAPPASEFLPIRPVAHKPFVSSYCYCESHPAFMDGKTAFRVPMDRPSIGSPPRLTPAESDLAWGAFGADTYSATHPYPDPPQTAADTCCAYTGRHVGPVCRCWACRKARDEPDEVDTQRKRTRQPRRVRLAPSTIGGTRMGSIDGLEEERYVDARTIIWTTLPNLRNRRPNQVQDLAGALDWTKRKLQRSFRRLSDSFRHGISPRAPVLDLATAATLDDEQRSRPAVQTERLRVGTDDDVDVRFMSPWRAHSALRRRAQMENVSPAVRTLQSSRDGSEGLLLPATATSRAIPDKSATPSNVAGIQSGDSDVSATPSKNAAIQSASDIPATPSKATAVQSDAPATWSHAAATHRQPTVTQKKQYRNTAV
eukprot:scpid76103/ scgid33926/ 